MIDARLSNVYSNPALATLVWPKPGRSGAIRRYSPAEAGQKKDGGCVGRAGLAIEHLDVLDPDRPVMNLYGHLHGIGGWGNGCGDGRGRERAVGELHVRA